MEGPLPAISRVSFYKSFSRDLPHEDPPSDVCVHSKGTGCLHGWQIGFSDCTHGEAKSSPEDPSINAVAAPSDAFVAGHIGSIHSLFKVIDRGEGRFSNYLVGNLFPDPTGSLGSAGLPWRSGRGDHHFGPLSLKDFREPTLTEGTLLVDNNHARHSHEALPRPTIGFSERHRGLVFKRCNDLEASSPADRVQTRTFLT